MHVRPHIRLVILLIALQACQSRLPGGAGATPFLVDRELGAWVEAWNKRDLSLADQLFLESSTVSYFSSEREGLITGFPAIHEHHAGFGFVAGGAAPGAELWLDDIHASAYGDAAVVAATWFFGDRDGSSADIQRGPMTAVYVLDGTDYKIAHMHFSTYLTASDP